MSVTHIVFLAVACYCAGHFNGVRLEDPMRTPKERDRADNAFWIILLAGVICVTVTITLFCV